MLESKFNWYDLNSKDKDAAVAFYTALFGWTTTEWKAEGAPDDEPAYTMVGIGEQVFGGIVPVGEDLPEEVPSFWYGHIHVDDFEDAHARASKHGAQTLYGPTSVPTVGRFALIADPQGAVCSLFQPETEAANQPSGMTPGAVGWNELTVEDVGAAADFYGKVIGWKTRKMPHAGDDDPNPYLLLGTGGDGPDAAGLMKLPPGAPRSSWFLYFTVEDIDATCGRIEELGGSVPMAPFDVPGVGRMGVGMATDGSYFGIAEWRMAQSSEECD